MEKVKITKCELKESGMFVVGFNSGFGDEGEATGNTKWQKKECEYLEKSIGQIVSLETKQNGQYCNITKVDMSAPVSEEGKETYDKFAKGPITESEKVVETPKANLMMPKDIMIISQCLTKAWCNALVGKTVQPSEVLDAYRFFVLELEQNG